ncbi:MAG: TldD/PmbA family protein [Tissierellia bacterium]|nr:TldD/PmbA family protein [Tissierellia bacterium]
MLDERIVRFLLEEAMRSKADFVEVFYENRRVTNITMEDSKIHSAIRGRERGVGLRLYDGLNTIYVYTSELTETGLRDLARRAALALGGDKDFIQPPFMPQELKPYYEVKVLPDAWSLSEKAQFLREADEVARRHSELVSQVTLFHLDTDQEVLIANSDGLWAQDRRIRTRFGVHAIAQGQGELHTGFASNGASMGLEFYEHYNPLEMAAEASRIAVLGARAQYAPSGRMPVILDNGFGGVLFHEACGHSLEAAFISKGNSEFAGKLGEKIASEKVYAYDDATIPGEWGTTRIDDEGTPTRNNLLIEGGVLKSYLIDRLHARRMGAESTGSARRESYRYAPTSRMNNTFIAAGQDSFEDMIEGIEYGLYAKTLGGGSVNPVSGDFNFQVAEGYLIEEGKITTPLRGASLIGKGAEVLEKIDAVSSDLKLGQGMCGAGSGMVPASLGQPQVRVSELTVGGRQ